MDDLLHFLSTHGGALLWGALGAVMLASVKYLIARFGNWTLSVIGMLKGQTIEWHPNGNPKKWTSRTQNLKASATQASKPQTKRPQPYAKKTK